MIEAEQLSRFSELFSSANSILVVFSGDAKVDQVSAAVTLARSLQQSGKEVRLCAHKEGDFSQLDLDGMDISTELGNQNLSISFAYTPEQVDKVSYHIGEETQRFFLTIKPKKGTPAIDHTSVEFSYSGAEADLIVVVGVSKLEDLLQLYFGYEDFYKETGVLSINTYETTYGTFHFDVSRYSSYSEAVSRLLNDLGWNIDAQMATNLLAAIDEQTQGFQSLSTTADTFETIARLIRSGGRRRKKATVATELGNPASSTQGTSRLLAGSGSIHAAASESKPISLSRATQSVVTNQSTTNKQSNQKSSNQQRARTKPTTGDFANSLMKS